ncbi:Protein DDI1-like 2 [Holothuria leucospilota]|uniref:Protein DDI1-like 2 n=1 Tax=Holothuria leucospilota TaxID=206669 RepID=A0A9Q0YG68_HOLLE|nr:Protein DDI1-like 2 [Holothuria leucospilota]
MKVYVTFNGDVVSMDVSPDLEVENFKALCEVECGVPTNQCLLSFNGVPLLDVKKSLASYGIKDDEMILLQRSTGFGASNSPGIQSQIPAEGIPTLDFSNVQVPGTSQQRVPQPVARQAEPDPATLREMLLSNQDQIAWLKQSNPPLADALINGSLEKFTEVLQKQRKAKADKEMQRIRMLSADPLDASAQQLIAEEIRQRNVDANMETAIEHMPENFGQVIMLYIDCKVNGHPVKAFVDSGAQMTIMSQACAERCNIMRLVDRRWEGIAKGVGTQKIIGRVHLGQIEIGGDFLQSSFTILENQPMDMLLGLDMLKRHQCCIDLKDNKLKIGTTGSETPFLSESELPPCARLNKPEVMESEDHQLAQALAKSAEDMDTAAGPSNVNQTNSQAAKPNISEESITKLTDMGFPREDVIRELNDAKGDFNLATAKLIAKSLKAPGQQ